jgi:uncharacterized protein (TIGR02266 family)
MMESDPQLGSFNITARLFKLIHDMPKDQQLILLKQLIGEHVTRHLFKLIVEMSEDQQIILLEQMGEAPAVESPITTVSLEETGPSMRENPRKPCLINANYRIQDRDFKSYILDISIGGVFIETDQKLPVGKDMMLKFSLPSHTKPFTLRGKVAWSSPRGFGVKFREMSPQQGEILKTFVDQNE